MKMKKTSFRVPSTDGIHTLSGVVYRPDGKPKGVLHVVHGMAEYIGRYDEFMTSCCEDGFLVCGYDHLGHGDTARDKGEYGFIAPKNGWRYLVKDVQAFREAVGKHFGVSSPYVLMGHSMGSFVVRLAAAMNEKPDKLIVMGTGGKNPAAGAGIALAKVIELFKGKKYISRLLVGLAFKGYNDRFSSDPEPDKVGWLTVDKENRKRYLADEKSGFLFTVSGMRDLVTLNKKSGERKCFAALSPSLPVLLVSGADDPVGNYGEGVKEVCRAMEKQGLHPQMKLYEGARHEILQDFCKKEVTEDILAFLNA